MTIRLPAVAATALVLATGAPAGHTQRAGTWTSEPRMLDARAAHAVVTAGGSILALGGTGARGEPIMSVERFDGRQWTAETRLPVPGGLNAAAAAAIGTRVYVIGGFSGTGNVPTDEVHVYDLATRTWSKAARLPAPTGGHAAVVLDGRIHILGGGNSISTLATHSVYDPRTDRWATRAPLRRAKGSPAAAVLGGRIYAIGGRSGTADFGDVEIYEPDADRWRRGPAIPPRGAAGATVDGRSIYVFGGESQSAARTLRDALRLRPGSRAWERVTPMPTARAFARAVTFRGAIYVVGGSRVTASSHGAAGTRIVERLTISARAR